jgi:hypothetical protein
VQLARGMTRDSRRVQLARDMTRGSRLTTSRSCKPGLAAPIMARYIPKNSEKALFSFILLFFGMNVNCDAKETCNLSGRRLVVVFAWLSQKSNKKPSVRLWVKVNHYKCGAHPSRFNRGYNAFWIVGWPTARRGYTGRSELQLSRRGKKVREDRARLTRPRQGVDPRVILCRPVCCSAARIMMK